MLLAVPCGVLQRLGNPLVPMQVIIEESWRLAFLLPALTCFL